MNISFSLTLAQFKARTKTVTRRVGWKNIKAGEILEGVEQAQGLKRGERVVRLGKIRVASARRETLRSLLDNPEYGRAEVRKEGFPDLSPAEFVDLFCRTHAGIKPESIITRIEFEYL